LVAIDLDADEHALLDIEAVIDEIGEQVDGDGLVLDAAISDGRRRMTITLDDAQG
jgi:hypothetical protein